MAELELRQIRVYGIVQGVGFRPTVDRHAHAAHVTGTVANKGSYVEIHAEGTPAGLDAFIGLIRDHSPERSVILKMDVKTLPASAGNGPHPGRRYEDFRIVESEKTSGEIFISPDIAICGTCKRELFDPENRRYLHPFINCTLCGPRFSLLEELPYDRERTSMKKFAMCPECAREYRDPASRRYDAQPVCCNDCGPQVYLLECGRRNAESGKKAAAEARDAVRADGNARRAADFVGTGAITRARQILAEGGVIAVKGIGGFHLACDATNPEAVNRLRARKTRPMKPFAVMARDLAAAERECEMSEAQRKILTGHQKPILLLPKRDGGKICPEAAPGIPTVGVMLPYAPVQLLLFTCPDEWQEKMPDVLVMTSGNAAGAPIASTDDEALREIAGFCDAILSNDRDIRIRTDDSVMDFYDGEPYMIRRSRGYAPIPYILSHEFEGRVLGMGGELKNTFCLGVNSIFYPSAYVGDLADVRTVRALEDAEHKTETLLEMEPEIVAADLHPKYNSVMVAEKIAGKRGIPLVRVQHHYAHILSCMAENDCLERVIGISFDGTGYGTDGTIWGGEFLLSDPDGFTRMASIKPFLQIGGDASARDGWRIAVSMMHGLCGERAAGVIDALGLCDAPTARVQKVMYEHRLNAVASTSAGRLFDAVSAILGIRRASTYEGEAATELMYAALRAGDVPQIPDKQETAPPADRGCKSEAGSAQKRLAAESEIPAEDMGAGTDETGVPAYLRTDALVLELTEAKLAGEDSDALAYRFHEKLAGMIVQETVRIREKTGVNIAALSGGVFQNRLLLGMVERGLAEEHFRVLRHHLVPPNDGGIALGQALYAMRYLERARGDGGPGGDEGPSAQVPEFISM